MSQLEKIHEMAQNHMAQMGFSVVQVTSLGKERKVIQVMIEKADGSTPDADDCALASRSLSLLFDHENVFQNPYVLEVSSPGIERPLISVADFSRFCGRDVVVKTKQSIIERKKFIGKLESVNDSGVVLALQAPIAQEDSLTIAFDNIKQAHLYVDYNKLLRG